jgi:hypothetical protein
MARKRIHTNLGDMLGISLWKFERYELNIWHQEETMKGDREQKLPSKVKGSS